ncbi:hypothetical protein V8E36_001074 [Tilletia maclaganii]
MATSAPQGPRIGNHYIRRLAGTPRPCLVCYRPSPVVLVSVSIPNEDFFYICAGHLTDRHFATLIPRQPQQSSGTSSPSASSSTSQDVSGRLPDKVSKEEIDKVTREWKERQKAKEDRQKAADEAKEKEKEKEAKGWLSTVAGAAGSAASGVYTLASSAMTSPPPTQPEASPASAPTPSLPPGQHEHYQLHKDYYAMRRDTFNKRDALRRAKELNMPSLPSLSLPAAPPRPS